MRSLPSAWRSRWWWWVLPVAFCLFNMVFLGVHRAAANSGFRQIQDELTARESTLESLVATRQALSDFGEIAERNREGLVSLYRDRLATEESRLTLLILEVKELARQAGLEPPSLSYSEQQIEEFGLARKSIVFGVSGRYAQIRALVNFLELSELFLILEEIRLREREGDTLGIDLKIATLFAVPDEVEAAVAGAGGQP